MLREREGPPLGQNTSDGPNNVGLGKRDSAPPNRTPARKQRRRRRPRFSLLSKRIKEIESIICFPTPMPLDRLRAHLVPYAQHVACRLRELGKPATHSAIAESLQIMCRVRGIAYYVSEQQLDAHVDAAVTLALKHPRPDKADALGTRLQLTFADRAFLRIKTIGACDVTKAERKRRRKARNREQARLRAASKRTERGAVPREQWLANSKSRTQPWKQQGISRRTYYRRLRNAAQNEHGTGWFDNNLSLYPQTNPCHVAETPKEGLSERDSASRSSRHTLFRGAA
jgi:hypothetical protein